MMSDTTRTLADGSTERTIVNDDGSWSVGYTPGPGTPAANQVSIQTKAHNALASNTAYVASTPTTAQALAQVKVLTQQNNALIRLLLQEFDTDS